MRTTDVPDTFARYSDRARRCADTITTHMTATSRPGELPWCIGRWVAIRLSDGGSDGALYDSKRDAVRHQVHETQCAYVCIPPTGMSAKSAESFLRFNEGLYAAGARLADPDTVVHQPLAREQQAAVIAQIRKGR